MDKDRDKKGKFAKGNIAAQAAIGKAKKRSFIPVKEMKDIENRLEEMRHNLEAEVNDPGQSEKILIDEVISQRRVAIYLDNAIKKFKAIDLRVIDLLLKAHETERRTLAALNIKHEKHFQTPLEKAAAFTREKEKEAEAEAELAEGEKGIL